jgi:hypothetical protein
MRRAERQTTKELEKRRLKLYFAQTLAFLSFNFWRLKYFFVIANNLVTVCQNRPEKSNPFTDYLLTPSSWLLMIKISYLRRVDYSF